jgi:hypothetical protein
MRVKGWIETACSGESITGERLRRQGVFKSIKSTINRTEKGTWVWGLTLGRSHTTCGIHVTADKIISSLPTSLIKNRSHLLKIAFAYHKHLR